MMLLYVLQKPHLKSIILRLTFVCVGQGLKHLVSTHTLLKHNPTHSFFRKREKQEGDKPGWEGGEELHLLRYYSRHVGSCRRKEKICNSLAKARLLSPRSAEVPWSRGVFQTGQTSGTVRQKPTSLKTVSISAWRQPDSNVTPGSQRTHWHLGIRKELCLSRRKWGEHF